MVLFKKNLLLSVAAIFSGTYFVNPLCADIQKYRWEYTENTSDNLKDILTLINQKSDLEFSEKDFRLAEELDLANAHFKTYTQIYMGLPIKGAVVRSWSSLKTGEIIQLETHLESNTYQKQREAALLKVFGVQRFSLLNNPENVLNSIDTMEFVKSVVSNHSEDQQIKEVTWTDEWQQSDLQRTIYVMGRRGNHKIVISHFSKQIISSEYTGFPTIDVQALVYPIYEQTVNGLIVQQRVPVMLKNILDLRKIATEDPYKQLQNNHYESDMQDPDLGNTKSGRNLGYWSWSWLSQEADNLASQVPEVQNSFDNYGVYLVGKYATINIHPDAISTAKNLKFAPAYSTRLAFLWKEVMTSSGLKTEVVPKSAYYGFPLLSETSALTRPARILADNNCVEYLNDGFDEIQVYYAINTLMESLHKFGFVDPELSTRPFHAFLYDPDVSMRDNAYYSFDTITFTTYSPNQLNFARDNSTIWHELGHGIMARLMGQDERLVLTDAKGLSEGMADFVAQLVINDVTQGVPFDGWNDFRIINSTGFYLTNEEHDGGEAYGGAMNDMLNRAKEKWGHDIGLQKTVDLTLDAMRLTRNHPALTAVEWFEHLVYADHLGSNTDVRGPDEMKDVILSSLLSRNFMIDGSKPGNMKVIVDNKFELTDQTVGSRYNNIFHTLGAEQKAEHEVDVIVENSKEFQFKYPVTLEVQFKGGPLQGSIKWENEEAGPIKIVLNTPEDAAKFKVSGLDCHSSNRDDGSCSDYVYMLLKNYGEDKPIAKKRLYLRLKKTTM